MFKVGEKSEAVTADRDGSRGRILTPEAVHEQAIHPGPGNPLLRIDVSAKSLTVAIQRPKRPDWTQVSHCVAPETKVPSLSVIGGNRCLLFGSRCGLDNAEGIEVAVLNPKVANRFAQTIRRSKTDAADAEVLAEYSRRMPFTSWAAPSSGSIRLRSIVRYIESLSTQSAQNQNRLHAAQSSAVTPGCVIQDLKRAVASRFITPAAERVGAAWRRGAHSAGEPLAMMIVGAQ